MLLLKHSDKLTVLRSIVSLLISVAQYSTMHVGIICYFFNQTSLVVVNSSFQVFSKSGKEKCFGH